MCSLLSTTLPKMSSWRCFLEISCQPALFTIMFTKQHFSSSAPDSYLGLDHSWVVGSLYWPVKRANTLVSLMQDRWGFSSATATLHTHSIPWSQTDEPSDLIWFLLNWKNVIYNAGARSYCSICQYWVVKTMTGGGWVVFNPKQSTCWKMQHLMKWWLVASQIQLNATLTV